MIFKKYISKEELIKEFRVVSKGKFRWAGEFKEVIKLLEKCHDECDSNAGNGDSSDGEANSSRYKVTGHLSTGEFNIYKHII